MVQSTKVMSIYTGSQGCGLQVHNILIAYVDLAWYKLSNYRSPPDVPSLLEEPRHRLRLLAP